MENTLILSDIKWDLVWPSLPIIKMKTSNTTVLRSKNKKYL